MTGRVLYRFLETGLYGTCAHDAPFSITHFWLSEPRLLDLHAQNPTARGAASLRPGCRRGFARPCSTTARAAIRPLPCGGTTGGRRRSSRWLAFRTKSIAPTRCGSKSSWRSSWRGLPPIEPRALENHTTSSRPGRMTWRNTRRPRRSSSRRLRRTTRSRASPRRKRRRRKKRRRRRRTASATTRRRLRHRAKRKHPRNSGRLGGDWSFPTFCARWMTRCWSRSCPSGTRESYPRGVERENALGRAQKAPPCAARVPVRASAGEARRCARGRGRNRVQPHGGFAEARPHQEPRGRRRRARARCTVCHTSPAPSRCSANSAPSRKWTRSRPSCTSGW